MATATATRIAEPRILTAPVYFWFPAERASGRRSNERRRLEEVADWLESLGIEVLAREEDTVWAQGHDLDIVFQYSESCNHIYRTLSIRRMSRGKWVKSNISALRKLALSQVSA